MMEEMVKDFRIPSEKLIQIYYPVDFRLVRELGDTGPDPFGDDFGPRMIAAGRLCSQKGFDVLLTAMQFVRQVFAEAQLAILGQGPLEDELRLLACLMGVSDIVHFHGFQQNPWLFINHADVFILPSRYEGLPNVLLEAMALDKQVVATDCSGGVRELQTYMPDMILVPPDDPRALAEGIIKACKTLRARRKTSVDAVVAFGVQQIVEEYSRLLLN